ncbi:MAG: hypothetical protein ABIJ47_03440 [Candidatus Bathyarchaeota archaeon]
MHITLTTLRGREGSASIFGTLIFIGILFTAVIPMYLVMNQADTIFEQRKHEATILDEDRSRESILVYAYPNGETSEYITVRVKNECALSVKMVRVWINNVPEPISVTLNPLEEVEIGQYDVDPQPGDTFDVRVTTERGNIFECGSGLLEYGTDGWVVESKMINVVVSDSGVVFKIYLSKWEDPNWVQKDWAQVWKIGGSAFKPFDISNYGNGEFRVVVKRGSTIIHDEEDLMMNWPNGPSVLWVYA